MKPNQAVIVAMHLLGLRLTSLLEIITIKDVDINSRTILYKYNGTRGLLFTHHCPARCFGMNMPKSRDIQAKIPLPQAIWNEFWLRYCERSEQ